MEMTSHANRFCGHWKKLRNVCLEQFKNIVRFRTEMLYLIGRQGRRKRYLITISAEALPLPVSVIQDMAC